MTRVIGNEVNFEVRYEDHPNFEVTCEGHQNYLKTPLRAFHDFLMTTICDIKLTSCVSAVWVKALSSTISPEPRSGIV